MYRINKIILFTLLLSFLAALPLYGGWMPWNNSTLVSIDGENYSNEDFKTWWKHWQEKDMQFPQSPDPFIDWILLSKEAERMKLYESPGFRNKVLTFLKVRTLMYLKAEEIDSKIIISEEDLWDQYLKTHAPQYQLHIFFFKKQERAQAFVDKIGPEPVSNEEFATSHGREDDYFSQRSEWYRPLAINPGWLPILNGLKKGTLSKPVPWKKDFVVLRMQDVVEGSRADFAMMKNQLQEKIWKREEGRLTADLLARLREQYHVKIDTERLEKLDTEASDDAVSDTPLIFTDKGNISEKIVLAKIRQIQRFRKQNGFKVKKDFQFKNQVVNGIIDQTLTSWDALDRNYEQKPPLEAIYKFYCQNRLTNLLEERIFVPQVKVEEKEIEVYYQKNLTLFTRPEIIRMAIVEGGEEALKALWLEVAVGGEFMALAHQRTGHEVPIRDIPVGHLHAKVKEVLDKLTKNEVSRPFMVDGHMSLVQLVDRKPQQTMPLAEVREDIKKSLQATRLALLRQDYLDKLRIEYPVEINDNAWQSIKTEMEQDD